MSDLFSKLVIRVPLQPITSTIKKVDLSLPLFKEGLYIAAFDLWTELEKVGFDWDKLNEKARRSVFKYWVRSCTRCTPYGLFAGTFLTSLADETIQVISDSDYNNMKIRLDMNFFNLLIEQIAAVPVIKQHLKYVPNNSLYLIADSYRYAESISVDGYRNYELMKVIKTDYLSYVLSYLSGSEKTVYEISNALVETFQVSLFDAREYVEKLINSKILVNNLEAVYTGKPSLEYLIDRIKGYDIKNNLLLLKIEELSLMLNSPEPGVSYFEKLNNQISDLINGHVAAKNIFQVDLASNYESSKIDNELVKVVVRQINDLKVFCMDHPNSDLSNFKDVFRKRYENREMPLTTVLDSDQGIGYGFSLNQLSGAHDLTTGLFVSGENELTRSYTQIHEFLIKKLIKLKELKKQNLEITEDDINTLNSLIHNKFDNTDKFIMGSLMKKNGRLDKYSFQFELKSFGGTNSANLIGRFSTLSADFDAFIREIITHEESFSENTLYAEVVHVPHPRLGNVISRTNFREYEIPYISNSGISIANQIPVNDLMVSIQDDEVVLRSIAHDKKVIPCLTTAHNFSQGNLPIYKFLCDLQLQNRSFYNWDWGPLSNLDHLPRVVYKNIIIQPAKWKVNKDSLSYLPAETDDLVGYFDAWRSALEMPALITISDSDNELFIDFKNEGLIEVFLDFLNKKQELTLKEFLTTEENSVIKDKNNNGYNNEIIIPLKKQKANRTATPIKNVAKKITKRFFEPGSEWLNVKIYGGNKNLDAILCTDIYAFVKEFRGELFDHFFFVRYFDTDNHIRLRFFNPDKSVSILLFERLTHLLNPFVQAEKLFKIQIDTYERELERYGDNIIFESEQLFDADSAITLEFLNLLDGNEEKYRWLFAMRGIDHFLNDFGISEVDKYRLIASMSLSFFNEHGGNKYLRKQINSRFRQHQEFIFSHMDENKDSYNDIEEISFLLMDRSKKISNVVNLIKSAISREELYSRISSYIHMFMNRLFISQQRKCELVVYTFLERHYSSQRARHSSQKQHIATSE